MIIKKLSFKFDECSKIYFFKDLASSFAINEVNFIQGDNGVGKSTLFSILQGETEKPSFLDAEIVLDGMTYRAQNHILPKQFTQHVHTVLQNYDSMIANQFTFKENLQLANVSCYPTLQSLPEARLCYIMDLLGIDVTTPAYLLSGGQRQILAILMALQKPTKLLLLDEPTATLDAKNAQLVMQCLYTLADQLKVTMLVICHDKELVAQYARDQYFVMRQDLGEDGSRILETRTLSLL